MLSDDPYTTSVPQAYALPREDSLAAVAVTRPADKEVLDSPSSQLKEGVPSAVGGAEGFVLQALLDAGGGEDGVDAITIDGEQALEEEASNH